MLDGKGIAIINGKKYKLKKIVFLGDIKHFFGYEWKERLYFKKVLEFLVRHVNEKDIILIKGNHDKFDFSGKKMKNYYFSKGIMFFHGHMDFLKINEERVKMWVMGHLHPSILLSDRQNIKREKYKCFLRGVYRGKEVIIVPSFFGAIEGSPVNSDEFTPEEGFSVIPPRELESFSAFVVTENEEVFDFGKVKNLQCA